MGVMQNYIFKLFIFFCNLLYIVMIKKNYFM